MNAANRTASAFLSEGDDFLIPGGLVPPPAELPAERTDVPLERRERAAAVILAATRFRMPEQIVRQRSGVDEGWHEIDEAMREPLQRAEALDLVDLVLEEVLPPTDADVLALAPADPAVVDEPEDDIEMMDPDEFVCQPWLIEGWLRSGFMTWEMIARTRRLTVDEVRADYQRRKAAEAGGEA